MPPKIIATLNSSNWDMMKVPYITLNDTISGIINYSHDTISYNLNTIS